MNLTAAERDRLKAAWESAFVGMVGSDVIYEPVIVAAAAKCAYCGRFGPLGKCDGCGAPNEPAPRGYQPLPILPLGEVLK